MKKRVLFLFLSLCLLFSCAVPAFAVAADDAPSAPTVEELQEMFPNVALGEDGYIAGTARVQARSGGSIALPDSVMDAGNPARTYYNSEENCTLMVYADGSYASVGTQATNSNSRSVDYDDNYVYWRHYLINYSLAFYVYHSLTNGLTTISGVSGPIVSYLSDPTGIEDRAMEAVGSSIIHASQVDASDCAIACTKARIVINSSPTVMMILYADIAGGVIYPRTATGIP